MTAVSHARLPKYKSRASGCKALAEKRTANACFELDRKQLLLPKYAVTFD
jgi:hypothetical protein